MNQAQAAKEIKVGKNVKLTQDQNRMGDYTGVREDAGKIVKITKIEERNDYYYFTSPTNGNQYAVTSAHIIEVTSEKSANTKFNQNYVENLRRLGGNEKMKTEIALRVNLIKNTMTSVMTEDKAKESLAIVDAALREIKLLRKNIKGEPKAKD